MFFSRFNATLNDFYSFIVYFISAIILLLLYAKIYEKVTPFREYELIRQGNTAAAISYGGSLLGFSLALASAIMHSPGLGDMILWGFIALLIQIFTFVVVKLIFKDLVAGIKANKISEGIFLGVISLMVGILNGACIS
jgi:putative membrane protein